MLETSAMAISACSSSVIIMFPMDTIKSRMMIQPAQAAIETGMVPYKGMVDCARRVLREEGVVAVYRGLTPRLVGVVSMVGIQYIVYEALWRVALQRAVSHREARRHKPRMMHEMGIMDHENVMEFAEPFPTAELPPAKDSFYRWAWMHRRRSKQYD